MITNFKFNAGGKLKQDGYGYKHILAYLGFGEGFGQLAGSFRFGTREKVLGDSGTATTGEQTILFTDIDFDDITRNRESSSLVFLEIGILTNLIFCSIITNI